MRRIQRIFIIAVFVLMFSVGLNAQQIPPSYGFLEVVDYKNEPVAGATVCRGDCGDLPKNQAQSVEKTNEKGLLEKGLRIDVGESSISFSIYKDGFYPFLDGFRLFDSMRGGWRNNRDNPIKIELLKIPENRAERKTVGNEQLKRDFFLAIYRGDAVSLRKLLKSNINPDITTGELRGIPVSKSVPAIVYAADSANIEAVKELLAAGVKIRAKNSAANGILLNYLRADARFYSLTGEERARRLTAYENGIEILLDAGADPNVKDDSGKTPLVIAADGGYLRAVDILLKRNLSDEKNQKDLALWTAVWRNRYESRYEIAQLLLKNGASPNFLIRDYESNSDCASALMTAIDSSDLQMVELLLANGADVNLSCKSGNSAFSKALYRVRDYYYDKSLQQKSQKIVDLLFASGLDVKAVDNFGTTTLMMAIQYGNYPAVERLIKMGVPVNAKTKRGETALMLAASTTGRFGIVKLLIESGADVNAAFEYTNEYQGNSYYFCHTPLANAAAAADITDEPNDLTDIMQLLAANGANVNFKCANGETALTMAARALSVKGVQKLIELGADAKGEQGTLALKYAKERLKDDWKKRAERIVAMLEAARAKE
jgi:ankyrin repeat protein